MDMGEYRALALCMIKRISQPMRAASLILMLYLPALMVNAEVSVSGLKGEAEDNVRLMLSLGKEKCNAPEWKIRGLFAKADQEIDVALRALGYYHAVIKKSLAFNKACWNAGFDINAGPRVIVSAIDFSILGDARNDPAFQKLPDTFQLKPGSPLHHGYYEKMKSRIESLALERGYLNGNFTEKKLLIDKEGNTARIKWVFDSQKRMYFGEIAVEQDILNPDFVKKYIQIKEGEFYTSEGLGKTYNALSQSGYFETVEILPETENTGQQVPVTIKLHPKNRHHYTFGLGFDTDIGPLASASYINRRLNRRGHYLTSTIDISPVLSTADVQYNVPLENPVSDAFTLGGGLKYENTDTFKSKSAKLSGLLKHAFASGWKQTLFLDLSYEDFDTGTQSGKTLLLAPGASWLRSVSDNLLRPTKGYRLKFEVSGSYKNPLSDVSFAQGALSAVWVHPMPWKGKFIARTDQGAMLVDRFDKLPTSYRFYAGGINSVRGYDYKELGPKDSFGNIEGGRFLSVVSVEYEQAVLDNWGIAAFIDTGNAYNLNSINFKTGAGLGIRWYSPIGPVRVDFAVPMNEASSSFRIHFAAGARI
ncbi:Outer membrane protein [Candidatus Methylobacter favarea]|uniref:Translocation and assembly module subunit TamA n=1 Tax=Candidatus Methylobacter favarea TaxID=2707345 RepID=A0A8S0Y6Z9_9GAMM|nr:autotransporter assembly complex family protein [Candidatus Methylobacter favarea]CAA9892559.1 Outer membrane protein [Candidatus Methylobacter favarea]